VLSITFRVLRVRVSMSLAVNAPNYGSFLLKIEHWLPIAGGVLVVSVRQVLRNACSALFGGAQEIIMLSVPL